MSILFFISLKWVYQKSACRRVPNGKMGLLSIRTVFFTAETQENKNGTIKLIGFYQIGRPHFALSKGEGS